MDTLNLVYHKTDEKAISSHTLSSDVAELRSPDKAFPEQLAEIEQAIIEINENREETVNFKSNEIQLKSRDNCVYIAIDDIGVKRQKDIRKSDDYKKESKYVENTVAHIQSGSKTYSLTAFGMRNLFKSAIAFLLANDIFSKEIVFFTDGVKNIKTA